MATVGVAKSVGAVIARRAFTRRGDLQHRAADCFAKDARMIAKFLLIKLDTPQWSLVLMCVFLYSISMVFYPVLPKRLTHFGGDTVYYELL